MDRKPNKKDEKKGMLHKGNALRLHAFCSRSLALPRLAQTELRDVRRLRFFRLRLINVHRAQVCLFSGNDTLYFLLEFSLVA